MRLKIPLTGTVLVEGSVHGAGDLIGDNIDHIRPVDIDLGNVSWTMVDIDMENEVMIIDVEPDDEIDELTGEVNEEGEPVYKRRKTTAKEKAQFLRHAENHSLKRKSKDELYETSGSPRLKRPFKPKRGKPQDG